MKRAPVVLLLLVSLAVLNCGGGGGGSTPSSGSAGGSFTIEAGGKHVVALQDGGTVWCWGDNIYGQAGTDSGGLPVTAALQLGADDQWYQVTAGERHSLGIKDDGTLWGWGANSNYPLGTTNNGNMSSEIQIGSDADWYQVSTNYDHTLAIRTDGTLWAWGQNSHGQLATNAGVSVLETPNRVGTGSSWSQVSAGGYFSLALKSNGTLWGWGSNSTSQFGTDNGGVDVFSPMQVGTATDWSFVSAGDGHVVALKTDDTLFAWGTNSSGQAASVWTDSVIETPRQVGTDTWVSASAGVDHSLGVKDDGTLWAWGANYNAQLATATDMLTNREAPVQVDSDMDWVAVSAGDYFSVALKNDGTVWAWGNNQSGQIGIGASGNKYSQTKIGSATDWDALFVGQYLSYAWTTGRMLLASGYNGWSQLALGDQSPRKYLTPTGTSDWDRIIPGKNHVLGIKDDGTLWAWGSNSSDELGTGSAYWYQSPIKVNSDTDWVQAAVGEAHTLAMKDNGTLWAWGSNGNGQLGTANPPSTLAKPTLVASATSWETVYANGYQSFGIKKDNTLWAWGKNDHGQLGTDTSGANVSIPVQIGTDTWNSISAGNSHTLGINSSNELLAWGYNMGFMVGTSEGSWSDFTSPIKISSDTDWSWVGAGYGWSLGLKSTGHLYMWGSTYSGILGPETGPDTYNRTPTQWGTAQWQTVAAGRSHALGILNDGSLWGWGNNYYGEVPDGTAWVADPWQAY